MKSLILFVACLIFHLAGTWSLPLIDRDEPRFAEAAREMIQRGDYIVPYFNNHYRFDKPPLTYWFQTLSYRVFGENDFAARVPSAIAAAVVSVLLLAWGQRIGKSSRNTLSGRDASPKRPSSSTQVEQDKKWDGSESRPYLSSAVNIGWGAAIMFALCLQTFMHAKAAVADMWLVLFVTAASWAGYELLFADERSKRPTSNVQRSTFKWWWVFYVALAFAFLAKGPIGWTPLLTVFLAKLFVRDVTLNKRFAFLPGILLMLAIVSAWGIPALIRTHGDFFRIGIGRHVIERSFSTMEGHGAKSLGIYLLTLPLYFAAVFVSFFPWSIKLPWLTRRLARDRDAIDNYLLAGTLVIFLIFTFVKTKLPHYTLPAFPLLALLLARHWNRQGAALSEAKTTAAESRRSLITKPAIILISIYLAIALLGFPLLARFFPSLQLFNASKSDLRPEMEFGAVGYNEPSLVWYFRGRVQGFLDSALEPDEASSFLNRSGPRFVILPTTLAEEISRTVPPAWKRFQINGFNIAKGKRVDLTLILKPE